MFRYGLAPLTARVPAHHTAEAASSCYAVACPGPAAPVIGPAVPPVRLSPETAATVFAAVGSLLGPPARGDRNGRLPDGP
ncbi:hypothetical protein [Streptomyces achromogenes]|uniref:hypothetical protein n=1 Tax=Streptomyces achromogenes TaxID=67255 RepID=UPI0036B144A7